MRLFISCCKLLKTKQAARSSSILRSTSVGEPIVCTPQEAYTCFLRTEMDVLVLEDILLLKEEQPLSAVEKAVAETELKWD